jgi:hypothetical protein
MKFTIILVGFQRFDEAKKATSYNLFGCGYKIYCTAIPALHWLSTVYSILTYFHKNLAPRQSG